MSLKNEPGLNRSTVIDSNLVELNYYPLMTSLDKCNGSFNSVFDLSTKICTPSKLKCLNMKVFSTITTINEAKALRKYIPFTCKCKLTVQHVIQIKNGIMINVNASVKRIACVKKIIAGILPHVFMTMVSI